MPAVIATIKVKPGQGAEFETVAKEMAAAVKANEPGCAFYVLCRGDAPDTYVFLERYVDQAAVEAHRASSHFKEIGRRMGAFMDGKPEIKRLEEV